MYKLVSEGENHFELHHPKGHKVVIAKNGLSKKAIEKFRSIPTQALAEGGVVAPEEEVDRDPQGMGAPETVFDPLKPLKDLNQNTFPGGYPGFRIAEKVIGAVPGMVKKVFSSPNPAYVPPDSVQQVSTSPASESAGLQNVGITTPPPQAHGPDMSDLARQGEQSKLSSYGNAINRVEKASLESAKAIGAQGQQEAKIYDDQQKVADTALQTYNTKLNELNQRREKLMQEYQSGDIDPLRAWNNKSTAGKVSTVVGMIVGGLGGSSEPMHFFDKMINDDIESQKLMLGKKKSLLEENLKEFGNLTDATNFTRLQQATMIQAQLNRVASLSKNPQAILAAKENSEKLRLQIIAPLQSQIADNQTRMRMLSGLGGEDTHPAALVDLVAHEPGEKKQILEEIKNREMIVRNGPKIMKLFNQAAGDVSGLGRATSIVKTPRSVEALKGLLAPFFQTVDGTVRQAAFDAAQEAFLPSRGDLGSDKATRERALKDWITSQNAAPTARSKGLDLDKFKATRANFTSTTPLNVPQGYIKTSTR